jgi:hypothetical protein
MNLIILAHLSEIPSESLPFRYVTMIAKTELSMDVLIETEKELKDNYYNFLKNRGLLDYVEELVSREEKEDGIRIDDKLTYPNTILVKSIKFENVIQIIGMVKSLNSIHSTLNQFALNRVLQGQF